ncbi:MAG: type III restriction-modification system endonuclease [bacterium]
MAQFHFEKNLEHQNRAVNSIVSIFDGLEISHHSGIDEKSMNPVLDKSIGVRYLKNLQTVQELNVVKEGRNGHSNILDIKMETGTGKTYTYTKAIFELNKCYGIFKFIIIVPTLAIKAGTVSFLKSDGAREHFKERFGKALNLHIVEGQKNNKNKKTPFPTAVKGFVESGSFDKNQIQVLIINAGMVNSDTMQKSFDSTLFDKYAVPFDAIAATSPFVIIDEPHKFSQSNKTWENIKKMNAQYILRFGATFLKEEQENVIYNLDAVTAFNSNLVKGVIGYVSDFEEGKNTLVKFLNSDGNEATFELVDNRTSKTYKVGKKESLEKIHPAMTDLIIENLNKTTVVLSNGLELKKGQTINPYSYSETLQESMIRKAVKHHFEIEQNLLQQDTRIKPLTLFFIDNIDEYRLPEGYIRRTLEKLIKAEVEHLLSVVTDGRYRIYLEETKKNIPKSHGGYFSRDNSDKDEEIEKEVNDILHDKQSILDLNNPRRFIFSKWTLREGWDNPNVFQICKLRSSGSDTSKLQEVGRGLRLPVNEYGNRVKDKQFYLNYFVDFTERDFVVQLKNEINENSGALSFADSPAKLDDNVIKKICEVYQKSEDELLEELDSASVINRSNQFKENGFEYIKGHFPLIFDGISSNKIRLSSELKKTVKVRTEKYPALKELWEKLNEKVVLEYKIDSEKDYLQLLKNFFKDSSESLTISGIVDKEYKLVFEGGNAVVNDAVGISSKTKGSVSTMSYADFLKQLSQALHTNLKTLHTALSTVKLDINNYLTVSTIRTLKQRFDNYLTYNAIDKFGIEYQSVKSTIHPTKLTTNKGEILNETSASDIGIDYAEEAVADSYLFENLYFDSELEKENIKTNINEVIVFTKIPKNSIKIPVAGGKSYSPDFAYVIDYENGKKKLYFIVETKNTEDSDQLRKEEQQKIKHAETFFGDRIKIKFKTQFSNNEIYQLINEVYN